MTPAKVSMSRLCGRGRAVRGPCECVREATSIEAQRYVGWRCWWTIRDHVMTPVQAVRWGVALDHAVQEVARWARREQRPILEVA